MSFNCTPLCGGDCHWACAGNVGEVFPYAVVTAPRGNRFGARSLEEVEHFKSVWDVTHVIDHTTGSTDSSLCPPLPPGEDETCTHTPTCPTGSSDREHGG